MKQIQKSLLLAAAMIAVAFLAVFEVVPEEVAQIAPFLLLALFPTAWLGAERPCNPVKANRT